MTKKRKKAGVSIFCLRQRRTTDKTTVKTHTILQTDTSHEQMMILYYEIHSFADTYAYVQRALLVQDFNMCVGLVFYLIVSFGQFHGNGITIHSIYCHICLHWLV